MMTIKFTENFNKNNLVRFELDGEFVGERQMNYAEAIRTIEDARAKRVKVIFEEITEIKLVTIEEYQELNVIDVNLTTFQYGVNSWVSLEPEVKAEVTKEYKRMNAAEKYALKLADKHECSYQFV